jgi:hypothetical protein
VLQVFSQQFSVAQASAGARSRLAGIGGQKTKRKQARLWKFSFFESHIRATNAPARRTSIMTILLIMSKNSVCWHLSLPVNPVNPVHPVKTSLSACLKSTKENKSGLTPSAHV